MAPRFWIPSSSPPPPPRQSWIHGVIDEAAPSPKHNHVAVNTFAALLPRLRWAVGTRQRSPHRLLPLIPNRLVSAADDEKPPQPGRLLAAEAPLIGSTWPQVVGGDYGPVRRMWSGGYVLIFPGHRRRPPRPEHGDGIDRRRSHFCSHGGQKKWEGDSCQSSLIVAPLNSGVNGFLPDVNTA